MTILIIICWWCCIWTWYYGSVGCYHHKEYVLPKQSCAIELFN